MNRSFARAISLAMGSLLLGSGTSSGPAVPPTFARMFVSQCFSKKIFILAPPFSPSQKAADSIAQPCTNSIAFDASTGMLAVASGGVLGTLAISIYNPPFSGASVPRVMFSPSGLLHPRQLAWDGSGGFWIADDLANKVYNFRAPFSVTSTPVAVNTLATQPIGLAIDPKAGLMFVGDAGGNRICEATPCRVLVVPAPYTGTAVATVALGNSSPAAMAIDRAGRLFVGFDNGDFEGLIKVFTPPFVTGETAAYTLDAGDAIKSLAFDSGQNLYAQFHTGGVVTFNGPISASVTTPSAALGCPSGATCTIKNWAGLSFGP
jgi:hypothetical protein